MNQMQSRECTCRFGRRGQYLHFRYRDRVYIAMREYPFAVELQKTPKKPVWMDVEKSMQLLLQNRDLWADALRRTDGLAGYMEFRFIVHRFRKLYEKLQSEMQKG